MVVGAVISIHALREEGDRHRNGKTSILLYFNPRPPRGGRRAAAELRQNRQTISIHALREEGDSGCCAAASFFVISIHALREEGDVINTAKETNQYDFNPRPPRGGRPTQRRPGARCRVFQSTPSARRATLRQAVAVQHYYISIHALREEGDSKSGEKIHHVCSIIHTCAQFEKELYEGSGEMQNKSC